MKTKILSILLVPAIVLQLGFSGCAETIPKNATAQQRAQAAINGATDYVKFVVPPAITAWLLLQKDVAKQQQDAAFVYAGATALNSAATGEILTPAQLQSLIGTFMPNPDPRYLQLAQLLAGEYGTLYPLFKIAGTTPVKFFTEVAVQAQTAARPFLAPTPPRVGLYNRETRKLIAVIQLYYDGAGAIERYKIATR